MKRAVPRGRDRGPDASIFARRGKTDGPRFDPDLRFEDVVMDLREERPPQPLAEEKLPPRPPRIAHRARRARRRSPVLVLGGIGVLALGAAGYMLNFRTEPKPMATASPSAESPDAGEDAAAAPAAREIAVVPARSKAGPELASFRPLFDERDLAGWQGLAEFWRIEGGSLVGTRNANSPLHTFYCSRRTYRDFELRFSARLQGGIGNSGVQIRSSLVNPRTFGVVGPQCEVGLASAFPPGSLVTEPRGEPAIKAPKDRVESVYKPDQYNEFSIRCVGKHVTIQLNGLTTVDADFPSMPDEGIIAWQMHGTRAPEQVTFKNVVLMELDKSAPSDFQALFNGKDLSGWRTHSSQPGGWRVDGGVLTGSGLEASHLYSDRDYENFHLRLEARINDGGNGGVWARSSFGPTLPVDSPERPHGYEVTILGRQAASRNTGTLFAGGRTPAVDVRDSPAPSTKWFALDVIAEGERVVVRVNGNVTADYRDVKWPYPRGHIALGQYGDQSIVEFRKIEIRELAPGTIGTSSPVSTVRSTGTEQDDNYLARANLLRSEGKLDEAIGEYRKALKTRSQNGAARQALIEILRQQGTAGNATAAWLGQLERENDNGNGYGDLALYLSTAGLATDALTVAKQSVRLRPQSDWPHHCLALVYQDSADWDKAAAEWRVVVRLNPAQVTGHNNLAWSIAMNPDPRRRNPTEAILHARKAVESSPKSGTFYNTLCLAEYRAGNLDRSLTAAENSMKLSNGGGPYDWFVMAMVYYKKRDIPQAVRWFEKAAAAAKEKSPRDMQLRGLWSEAGTLLGRKLPECQSSELKRRTRKTYPKDPASMKFPSKHMQSMMTKTLDDKGRCGPRRVWLVVMLANLFVSLAACGPGSRAFGQDTTTGPARADGSRIPKPDPEFTGKIGETYKDSTPSYPQPVKAPRGAPNVLLILLDDVGFGMCSTFGGPVPTPHLDKLAKDGLKYTRFHTTALCSPTRAALLAGRNHHTCGTGVIIEMGTGYPGYTGIIPRSTALVSEILRDNGYATGMFGKWHNTPEPEISPAGPFDRWPTGLGFDYFYGFNQGETNQYHPTIYRNTTWVPQPQYG